VSGVPERFEAMEMRVAAKYSDSEMMRKLVAIAERACLVTNTLRTALSITIALEQVR
jgi:putative redox protein